MKKKADIVVIGCGNPWASDDGIGVMLCKELERRFPGLATFVTMPFPGVELLDYLEQCSRMILIDAVVSGSAPGTLHVMPLHLHNIDDRQLLEVSSHGLSIIDLLDLAANLNMALPELTLWGIEIARTEWGPDLSPELQHHLPTLIRRAEKEFRRLLSRINEGLGHL